MLFFFRSARRPRPRQARVQLGVECLDGRCLPSAIPLSPPLAEAALVADAGHAQPFHLSGEGLATLTSPTSFDFTASGHATQLGAWTNSGTAVIDPATGVVSGQATFVAANGDTLTTSISNGVLTPQADGSFHGTATFTITGGTGRFAGASGTLSMDLTQKPVDATHQTFVFTLDGTIALAQGRLQTVGLTPQLKPGQWNIHGKHNWGPL
jgi:hypothetical protein